MRSRTLTDTEAIRFGETMRKVTGATEDAARGRARLPGGPGARWRGR